MEQYRELDLMIFDVVLEDLSSPSKSPVHGTKEGSEKNELCSGFPWQFTSMNPIKQSQGQKHSQSLLFGYQSITFVGLTNPLPLVGKGCDSSVVQEHSPSLPGRPP